MDLQLIPAAKTDKTVMRHLLELYCYDFSEYLETDVNEHGTFEYPHVDAYWLAESRQPFFVQVDGKYAGLVLLNRDRAVQEYPSEYVMAEFFILRKYRRRGIGKEVVRKVFTRFPGKWEISVVLANEPAAQFWATVIAECTGGKYRVMERVKKGLPRNIYLFQI